MRSNLARILALAVVVCAPPASGQALSPLRAAAGAGTGPVTELAFDAAAWEALRGLDGAVLERFPIGGGVTVDLEVRPIEIFAPEARLVASSDAGDADLVRPDVLLLSARVADRGSRGFLAISPRACNGFIELEGHVHIISSGPPGAGLPTVVYDLTSLADGAIDWESFVCGLDALGGRATRPARESDGGGSPAVLPCRVAKIAVESDFEYTSVVFGGDAAASIDYIATLLGAVSEIYTADLNTRLEVSFARVWETNTDPYSGGTEDRFYQFQAHWNAKMDGVDRATAHMLSGAKGEWGGIGWIGGLCSGGSGYAISDHIRGFFPYPLQDHHKQNWDLMVVAHELGHNFGAPHTHDMVPRIDSCGLGDCSKKDQGTIMSYCNTCTGGMSNIALTLHQRIINEEIVPFLDHQAGCVEKGSPPTITQQPEGQSACEGSAAKFTVVAKPAPLTYQWRRDGADLLGAVKPTLTIDPVHPEDAGVYTVVVANGCGQVESEDAELVVGSCPADLNADCTLDVFDFLEFFNLFDAGDAAADCDGDGVVGIFDFLCFGNAFNAGC